MKKALNILKNVAISAAVIAAMYFINVYLKFVLGFSSMVPMIYVLGVFFISICTEGYFYGIASSVVSAVLVFIMFHRAGTPLRFTYEILSAEIIIFLIAIVTCTLTTYVKKSKKLKSVTIEEHMRANLMRSVSHDLRTPLTSIYGSASAILDNFDALNDEQRLELVREIKEESDGLIHLVENLLLVTRMSNEGVKLTKSPTVLEELVDAAVVKFEKYFPNAPLTVDIPEDIVLISIDPLLIRQVLTNILENAVLHAEDMTKLIFKAYAEGDKVKIEISDDGCGIPKENLTKIFNGYFASVSDSRHTTRRNMGIGLSACAAIIKAHGGQIYADNNDMGGASFYITLDREKDSE